MKRAVTENLGDADLGVDVGVDDLGGGLLIVVVLLVRGRHG